MRQGFFYAAATIDRDETRHHCPMFTFYHPSSSSFDFIFRRPGLTRAAFFPSFRPGKSSSSSVALTL